MSTIERVERVVAPVVESSGLELVDVEVRPGTVRVTVDRSGGVDLDTLGAATTAISRILDDTDAVPGGRYELEVSSPGVERRLRRPDHFQSHIGADVAVKTKPGVEGDRRVEGVLAEAGPHSFRVEGDLVPGGSREIAYADVERAHTVFDWRAALAGTSAPGSRRQHKAERQQRSLHAAARNDADTHDKDETENP
jgi:ribosome maturation factor RimP